MSDNTEQFDKQISPQFSDEAIRSFLFGSLGPADQATFEERLFSDDRLETRVRLAECELADDYVFDRLSAAERELFEQSFLASAGRQQTVRVSEALRDRFATASAVTVATSPGGMTIGERLRGLLGLNQPSWKLALRVVILILLVGTMWSVLRGPRLGQKFFAKRRSPPVAIPPSNQQEAHHTKASPVPRQEQTPAPPGSERVTSATIQLLVPQHGYDPVHLAQVSFPDSEHNTLRVQLTFKVNQEMYRAELLTIAGQSVFTALPFQPAPGSNSIDFDVPGRVLNAGDYQVKLIRVTDGGEQGLATYYFHVQ